MPSHPSVPPQCQIKAVFFDWYNTIAHFNPPREEVQVQALREFGLEVSPEALRRGYSAADDYFSRENGRLSLARRSEEERTAFYARYEAILLREAGLEVSPELAAQVFAVVRRQPTRFALFDDVLPALSLLKARDLSLGLLSNIHRDLERYCADLGVRPYFDFLLTSQEVGAEKPHRRIFLAALERARVSPEEALHIGDQYNSDVVGARGVGIRPLLLDRDGLLGEIGDCDRIKSLLEIERYLLG